MSIIERRAATRWGWLLLAALAVVGAAIALTGDQGQRARAPDATSFTSSDGPIKPESHVPTPSPRFVSRPGDCGAGATFMDYLGGAGWATSEGAVRAFIDDQARLQPTDAKGKAERAAVLASATALRDEGRVIEGNRQYAARDEDGVLAIYWVSSYAPDKFVVSSFWVRLPAELCPPR